MKRVTKMSGVVHKSLGLFKSFQQKMYLHYLGHSWTIALFCALTSCSPENRQLSTQPTKAIAPRVTYRPIPSESQQSPDLSLSKPPSKTPNSAEMNPSSPSNPGPTPSTPAPVPVPVPVPLTPPERKNPPATAPAPVPSPAPGGKSVSNSPLEKSIPTLKQMRGGTPFPVKATVYFTPSFKIKNRYCQNRDLKNVVDIKYNILGELCPKDFDSCVMEGACHIETERGIVTVNFSKRDHRGDPIFFVVDTSRCPSGLGVQSSCLDPFYTVAADLRVHKPGEVIYISEVRGLPLPDGTRHTGYFIVRDTGSRRFITGRGRFDFFTDHVSPFDKKFVILKYFRGDKAYPMHFVSVGMISPELATLVKKVRNFPLVPPRSK